MRFFPVILKNHIFRDKNFFKKLCMSKTVINQKQLTQKLSGVFTVFRFLAQRIFSTAKQKFAALKGVFEAFTPNLN